MKYAVVISIGLLLPYAAGAEAVHHAYDAKGRLVRVAKAGGPSSGTVTTYGHDKANNRRSVRTSGAPR